MQNLKGKIAFVTGGGRGLGKAVALALATKGVNVAITGRNENNLKSVVAEIESKGVKSSYSVFDVTDKKQVFASLEKLQNDFGKFDILINNAGIAAFGGILEMDDEQWEDIVKTNLFGPYYVVKAVVPGMVDAESGWHHLLLKPVAAVLRPQQPAPPAGPPGSSQNLLVLHHQIHKASPYKTLLF